MTSSGALPTAVLSDALDRLGLPGSAQCLQDKRQKRAPGVPDEHRR
jgi:hypothetical protein